MGGSNSNTVVKTLLDEIITKTRLSDMEEFLTSKINEKKVSSVNIREIEIIFLKKFIQDNTPSCINLVGNLIDSLWELSGKISLDKKDIQKLNCILAFLTQF